MEVCKIVGGDGHGDQDEYDKMVATSRFLSFVKTDRKLREEEGITSAKKRKNSYTIM